MSKWKLLRSALLDGNGRCLSTPSELSIHAHRGFEVCPYEEIPFQWATLEVAVHTDDNIPIELLIENEVFKRFIAMHLKQRDSSLCWISKSSHPLVNSKELTSVHLSDSDRETQRGFKVVLSFQQPEAAEASILYTADDEISIPSSSAVYKRYTITAPLRHLHIYTRERSEASRSDKLRGLASHSLYGVDNTGNVR